MININLTKETENKIKNFRSNNNDNNMEQRENYIKNTVAYFREQIEERGFVRYSEIIEKCNFDGMVDYKT